MPATSVYQIPQGLVFLPLGEESLILLKRAVVPLVPAAALAQVWWQKQARHKKTQVARVDEQEYLAHLEHEYQRLPANLQGLLTQAQFIEQAEKKRPEIEAALLAHKKQQAVVVQGSAEDWLLQRFYLDPYSSLVWQQVGWGSVWLGIDPKLWPNAPIQPVHYGHNMPTQFPQRLCADAKANEPLAEQRLIMPAAQLKQVTVAGRAQGLLPLPSAALRCVLFGTAVRTEFERQFMTYWRQDLRYRHTPVARMYLHHEQFQWEFQLCQQ